jgi:DNA-binding PadR family transcriptional regulator
MSSTTRLLVLGIVKIFQPVHGYDVRRELISWHAEEWANVAPGSIYSALKTLVKDGCLEVVGTEQAGARPERTTFKLTVRGDVEFGELLRDQLWTVRMPTDPLIAAISLMGFLERKELVAALEARTATIQGQMKHAEYVIAAIDDIETPDHVREMMRLINARVGAEVAWASSLRRRLIDGEYRTLGSPPWHPKAVGEAAAKKPRSAKRKKKSK